MSSAIRLPFFFHKVSSKKFQALFDLVFRTNPGLRCIDHQVAISYVTVASPDAESLRVALALQSAMKQMELGDEQLEARLGWYIRDYMMVGDIISEGEDGERCTVVGPAGSATVSPYVFAIVLSGLLRSGAIDGHMSNRAVADRSLELVKGGPGQSAIATLVAGSPDYEMFHGDHPLGAEEQKQLEAIAAVV